MRPQTIVERLDFVAKRIPGLKFTPPTQLKPGDDQGYGCFMSCDMYYIEIKVDQSHQFVKDVVISHGNNADGISCPVLRKVLADQDFETFAKHLSGLHSIYQITTNDKKVKQRAYPALSALETDLTILYDHQRRRTNNCHDLVHKSPIGIMEPRRGGLPVRLNYFTTPYDLVDTAQKGFINLTVNNIIDKNLGLSATVEIEGSNPSHKLQVKSLISTQHNSSLPAYAPFNSQNSEKLPAQFVLRLCQPFPMLNTSINQIVNEINEPATIKEYLTSLMASSKESLISLIARQELDLNKGPFCRSIDSLKGSDNDTCDLKKHVYSVQLLDQYHTYHLLDNYLERQDGVYVTKIPFTHPTSIPNIIRVLRQQALFNFIIGSCIRRNRNNNNGTLDENVSKNHNESNIFDVIPINLNTICVSFEHPSKKSLATLEIDFKELSCQLYAVEKESVCSNEFATKVLQKCWSIPITLRSVLKKCNERRLALLEDANKRRERELQELLTNNPAQSGLQYKSHLQFPETLMQSKFSNLHEKTNSRDLNSINEFLNPKMSLAGTSDSNNQTNANVDGASIRSNLLKKYSCKPKAKQNAMTKNQTGSNKILSLMLKRQNSTPAIITDANLKATTTKKAKMKGFQSDTNIKNPIITTTKLISSDVATASRLANRQIKQGNNNLNVSLIRSPNKAQQTTLSPSSTSSIGVNLTGQGLASCSKQIDLFNTNSVSSNNIRLKTLPNGGNNNGGKPRKSSIGAVLDRLVGGLAPEQTSSVHSSASNDSNSDSYKNQNSPLGAKSKSKALGDQFAIKQGSLGSLKLTVTKTKPASTSTIAPNPNPAQITNFSSTPLTSSSSTSSSNSSASSSSLTNATNNTTSTATSITAMNASTNSNASSISQPSKSDASKLLGIGSTPSIKYTIPKISKAQQGTQSVTNQANSIDGQNSSSNDANSPADDSSNPSSSANTVSAPSSTTNKRTTSTPFNRTFNLNRNPVSSSTHPRTTSNPLAISSRPSSTSNSDNVINRITGINSNQQNLRQQMNNRMSNLQQQQTVQRLVNPSIVAKQLSNQPQMFALGFPQQQKQPHQQLQQQIGLFQGSNDINLLATNQAALLNQQRNQNSIQSIPAPFMSSSVDANIISSSRPQFTNIPQQISVPPATNSGANVCDSLQRPSPSVIPAAPQFYIRQPMFDDSSNSVSSTPRMVNEASQSNFGDRKLVEHNFAPSGTPMNQQGFQPRSFDPQLMNNLIGSVNAVEMSSSSTMTGATAKTLLSGQGVSSSSDSGDQGGPGPAISTPSSPVDFGSAEIVPPPPMIPIDSLDEPQPASPDADHPDDESDRLSIVDVNENIADSNSAAGTPKPSSVNSPMNTAYDSNSAVPSSSSRNFDSASISSANNSTHPPEPRPPSNRVEVSLPSQSTATSTTSESPSTIAQSSVASSEEISGLARVRSSVVLGPSDDALGPQSTMAATTSDMI